MRSEDNRDQIRKLSEIAPNFGRFFASQILGGGPSKNGTHIISPALRHVDWKMFREETPISLEVIVDHTMNFNPNLIFTIKIFWEGPRPSWGVG